MKLVIYICVFGLLYLKEFGADGNDYVKTFDAKPEESNNSTFKTVCYFPFDPNINISDANPLPVGLDPWLCSHVILFASIICDSSTIIPSSPVHLEVILKAVPVLRKLNPELTIMVSNGGNFDLVLKSLENISKFVNSVVIFLRKYGLDGIDLDWEFPGWPIEDKPEGQIHNFSIALTDMRKAFDLEAIQTNRSSLLLSVAVAATKEMALKIYEMEYLKKAVDFVNMMGYDYNGWGLLSPLTAYNSPLFPESYDKHAFNTNNLAWCATHWGSWIGKEKVMVGIPFYCHAYKLLTSKMHGYHSIAIGKGECDQAGYTCACDALKHKNATRVFDNAAKVPYLYYGDQWVSYDDVTSITIKTKWILDNGFPGLMVWHMTADDYAGVCDGKTTYPLMKAALKTIHQYKRFEKQHTPS